jgi:hypothetical protein
MKRCAVLTLLCLTACAQQSATSLEQQSAGGVEVMPADSLQAQGPTRLQRPPFELQREAPTVPAVPIKATSTVTRSPAGANTVTDVREIQVSFDVSNATYRTTAAAEFVGPSGQPYQRLEAAIGVAPPADDHLTFELPVAGTIIDTNKLSGVWSVRLLVDGQTIATQSFELTR